MTDLPSTSKIATLAIVAGLGGVLVFTNPSHEAYQNFAGEQLTIYLKEKVCTQELPGLGGFLESQCKTLVDVSRPQLKTLIREKTRQYNFLLFSIYSTELDWDDPLPSYQFSTLGILNQFHIYQAEKL